MDNRFQVSAKFFTVGFIVPVLALVLAGTASCGSSSGGADAAAGGEGGGVGGAAGGVPGLGGAGGMAGSASVTGGAGLAGSAGPGGAGAGGKPGPVTTPTTALELCRAFCQRLTTCDTSRDLQTCVNACTNANSAVFTKLRTEVVTSIATCVAQKDCATIAQDTFLRSCTLEAGAAIGPSAAVTAYCNALDVAQTQCGVTIDKSDCLTSTKIYADTSVTEAAACNAKSCSLIYGCASATLTQASGSWALGGGLKPGKKCTGTANPCSYFSSSSGTQCMAAGCTYTPTCTGTIYCSSQFTMAACQAITGCAWSGTACSGTPTVNCAAQPPASCTALSSSCFASGTCTGTVPACATLGASACTSHPGCLVQDAL